MKKNFHIIGAGKVGQTLARLLYTGQQHRLIQICGGHQATLLADCCNGEIVPYLHQLSAADIILLTTPDNAIAATAKLLAELPWLSADTLVVHCSGAKSIAELAPLAELGVKTGSLHPVFAFADVDTAVATLPGSLCALEADNRSMEALQQLAAALALRPFPLPSEHKARYHAALSAASNFSVTLAAYAQTLLSPLALPEPLSRELVVGLMQQSLHNLATLPPQQALTGPIVRGDDSTINAHLTALSTNEQYAYRTWALQTLALAATRLDKASAAQLAAILKN